MVGPAIAVLAVLACPSVASAYIGPGAGFALISSFFVVLTTMVLALVALLRWPFRVVWRMLRRGARPRAEIRRLIVIGFDGQEPTLTDRWLKEGGLPHFAALARGGGYHRLRTTFPPVSPVAWSSFSTGTNPGRHRIFDFLDRDRRSYLPVLSSTHIGRVDRVLKLGRYRIPLRKPELRLLRKSQPFWTLLGQARIWSTVLRVPISFPPDRFHGAQLSAMAAPDLLGTQGTFLLYTTRPAGARFKEGGIRVPLTFTGDRAETQIAGPEHPFATDRRQLALSMRLTRDRAARTVTIDLPGRRVTLTPGYAHKPGPLSDWIPLAFRAAPFVKIRGLCRMQVTEMDDEHVSLYVTPISLDPEHPAMPISHPSYYAAYLAKKIGPYSTLGLAEDTWALNEGVIDDETFLRQAWDIDDERQRMCLAALDRLRVGALVCVFDATDRVQHMFWRHLDRGDQTASDDAADTAYAAARGAAAPGAARPAEAAHGGGAPGEGTHGERTRTPNAIEAQYRRNDAFLGQVLARVRDDDVVMVLSDHGFTSFRRGVNVNRWLLDHGYLALKAGADGSSEWLRDVDWSRTRAYALGLTGIFLNVRGREGEGIVEPGEEAARIKAELIAGLSGLVDVEVGVGAHVAAADADLDGRSARSASRSDRVAGGGVAGGAVGAGAGRGTVGIRELFDTAVLYDGPYVADAPDLLVGYNAGYRVSWDCATGVVAGPLFADNTRPWSGDHCVDPRLVPGVFFCSRPIARDDPALIDIAPTALRLFGLDVPPHMEGRPLFAPATEPAGNAAGQLPGKASRPQVHKPGEPQAQQGSGPLGRKPGEPPEQKAVGKPGDEPVRKATAKPAAGKPARKRPSR